MAKNKYIESPEMFKFYFKEYEKETKANPFKQKDWVGKDGDEVYREKERPLTMEGFEIWLDENDIITDVSDYFENKEKRYTEYVPICRTCRKKIRKDQIEGGMAGIYNPSITQRLNGLVEQTQTDGKQELNINVNRGNRHKPNIEPTPSGTTES